ncbi:hypothetical protein ACFWIZ_50520, partial [Streptomyces sp. NPDC127044]
MRRVTVQKPLSKSQSRRVREKADERPAERPEVRKDIHRTWWPDECGGRGAVPRPRGGYTTRRTPRPAP